MQSDALAEMHKMVIKKCQGLTMYEDEWIKGSFSAKCWVERGQDIVIISCKERF